MKTHTSTGFTIVELLIVIVVIGILAAITIVAYSGVQDRAGLSRSLGDLSSLQKAIEAYKAINGTYPSSAGAWRNSNDNPTDYVPNLTPNTIGSLPQPQYTSTGGEYMYISNGADYKIMAHTGKYQDLCPQVKAKHPEMVPSRDCWAYAYYTPGGRLF